MEKKSKINYEMIMAISAIIVSISALCVSVFQVRLLEKQVKLSVIPRLDIGFGNMETEYSLGISVSNNGLGPAIIEAVEISYKGKSLKNWNEFKYEVTGDSINTADTLSTAKLYNRAIISGSIFRIFGLTSKKNYQKILNAREYIRIRIVYKSLYDEYWLVDRENMTVESDIINIPVDAEFARSLKPFRH